MRTIFIVLLLVCSLVFTSSVIAKPITPALTDIATPSDLSPITSAGNPYIGPKVAEAIVIHHSGSIRSPNLTVEQTVEGYRNWHKIAVHPGIYTDPSSWYSPEMPAQEGYPDGFSNGTGYNSNDLDYHFVVGDISTTTNTNWNDYIVAGRRLSTIGWHSSNWQMNLISIGVCFMGMFDLVAPKSDQYNAGLQLVVSLMETYKIRDIFPHSDFASKSCPGYAFPMEQLKADAWRLTGLYTDTNFDQWFRPYLAKLGKANLITGYPDGSFKPSNQISRAEFIYLLWKSNGSPMPANDLYISDVDKFHWAHNAITWAYINEIADGYPDGNFYPDKYITRAEIARIMTLFLNLTPAIPTYKDVGISHWASGSIGAVANAKIMTGDDMCQFNPDVFITRAESATVISRLLK